MTQKQSERRHKYSKKRKACQQGHYNSNENNELEPDLFPMNFFGEVVDYEANEELLVRNWGQCEDSEEDIDWLD